MTTIIIRSLKNCNVQKYLKTSSVLLDKSSYCKHSPISNEYDTARGIIYKKKLMNGPHLKDFFRKETLEPNWKGEEIIEVLKYKYEFHY